MQSFIGDNAMGLMMSVQLPLRVQLKRKGDHQSTCAAPGSKKAMPCMLRTKALSPLMYKRHCPPLMYNRHCPL